MAGEKGTMQEIKQKLQRVVVGRNREIEAIKMHFSRLGEGRLAVTVIAGDIGIGKTALVKAVLSDLAGLNGTCIYSKFEQFEDKGPYIPIAQIIEQITAHMLTLPGEKLDRIRDKLKKELGRDSTFITGLAPRAQKLIVNAGRIKGIDYQKLKIRLEKAFQSFLAIAARELYPLIVAIDDLQWADPASWNIIESIKSDETELYLILAYRNNLAEYITRVRPMLDRLAAGKDLQEINLESLQPEEVKTMLGEVFRGEWENVEELVWLIQRKTAGNPLFIKQLLNLLLESEGIYRHPETKRWCLDLRKATEVTLPDTIADVINRKIDSLCPEARELLEIASCIGSIFTRDLLERITPTRGHPVKEVLEGLCRAGLIVKDLERVQGEGTGKYAFFHDRVYQNVYENLEPARKEQLHFQIAMELLNHPDKIYVEENLLAITAHLLNCKEIIKREGVAKKLIVDLYFAGIKAKGAAAFDHARELFRLAAELLGSSSWTGDYENTLKIKLELIECEFICGNYDAARALFAEMLDHAASQEDLAEIKKRYMILNSCAGNHAVVIELGMQALRHLGLSIHRHWLSLQVARELLCGMVLFRNSRLEGIKNAPIVTDKRLTSVLEILNIMVASAYLTDENLFALIVLKIGNLSARYGNSLYSPLAYAAYSLILGNVLGDYKKADKLKDISLHLAELFGDDLFGAATYFCLGSFLIYWTSPARESLAYLQKAFDCGFRTGDYLYCGYALTLLVEMKYLTGTPLGELEKFIAGHEKYVTKLNNDPLRRSFAMFRDHINMLAEPGISPQERLIEDKDIALLDTNEAMIYRLLKIQRLYLEGRIEEAYHLACGAVKNLASIMGCMSQVDFVFYFLLTSLEMVKDKGVNHRVQENKAFRKYRKKLKQWAEMSPENHRVKHLLIEALLAGLGNRQQDAARLFAETIEQAQRSHNLLLEALANYLAADYFRCNGKIARVYARDASRLFSQWGAERIARRLGRVYNLEVEAEGEVSAAGDGKERQQSSKGAAPGILAGGGRDHQRELETRTIEEAYKYFLDTICPEAGADFAAILLEAGERLRLEYVWQAGRPSLKCSAGIDPEEYEDLPKKVIRYAGRTYEEIVIEARPTEGPFAGDEHIKNRPGISLICLPLKYNNIFTGLVYLESGVDNRFNVHTVESIKRYAFYLVARQALEREPAGSKTFVADTVKDRLTRRELEVLACMAAGLTNKEIGEKLHISASTVKTHTLNLYGKLEVNSRIQAVTKAKALKLI